MREPGTIPTDAATALAVVKKNLHAVNHDRTDQRFQVVGGPRAHHGPRFERVSEPAGQAARRRRFVTHTEERATKATPVTEVFTPLAPAPVTEVDLAEHGADEVLLVGSALALNARREGSGEGREDAGRRRPRRRRPEGTAGAAGGAGDGGRTGETAVGGEDDDGFNLAEQIQHEFSLQPPLNRAEPETLGAQVADRMKGIIGGLPDEAIGAVVPGNLHEILDVDEETTQAAIADLETARLTITLPSVGTFIVRKQPAEDLSEVEHVDKALRVGIAKGTLKPGTPLPTELYMRDEKGLTAAEARGILHRLRDEDLAHTTSSRRAGTIIGSEGEAGEQLPYERVAEDLEARIRSGEIEVGSKLATRKELASQYRVRVTAVTRASRLLQEKGYLQIGHGKDGTTVIDRNPDPDVARERGAQEQAKYRQLVAQYAERIREGAFERTHEFLSVAEIARISGVSHTTARNAVRTLYTMGLVNIHRGNRTTVPPLAEMPDPDFYRPAGLLQTERQALADDYAKRILAGEFTSLGPRDLMREGVPISTAKEVVHDLRRYGFLRKERNRFVPSENLSPDMELPGTPPAGRVANTIRARIQAGDFPGDIIPSETNLRAEHGWKLAHIQDALAHLAVEGWIERRSGVGSVIKRPLPRQTEENQ